MTELEARVAACAEDALLDCIEAAVAGQATALDLDSVMGSAIDLEAESCQ